MFVPLVLPVDTDRQTSSNKFYYYDVHIQDRDTLLNMKDDDNLDLTNYE